jgi:hypothetical protein
MSLPDKDKRMKWRSKMSMIENCSLDIVVDDYDSLILEIYGKQCEKTVLSSEYKDFLTKSCFFNNQDFSKSAIEFILIKERQDEEIETRIKTETMKYLSHMIYELRMSLNTIYRKSMVSFLISIALLTVVFGIGDVVGSNMLSSKILFEVLKVGGWMFMWQSLVFISFDRIDIKKKMDFIEHIRGLDSHFTYFREEAELVDVSRYNVKANSTNTKIL